MIALATAMMFYTLQMFEEGGNWAVVAIGAKRSGGRPQGLLGDLIGADAYREDDASAVEMFSVEFEGGGRPGNYTSCPWYGLRST